MDRDGKYFNFVYNVAAIMVIIIIVLTIAVTHLYNENKDLQDTIDIKNNRIKELLNNKFNDEHSLYTCKMARDENYELFMSCVYPDGNPYEEE